MARCVLVLGGVINGVESLKKELRDDDYFIYCDKGLINRDLLGFKPGLAVGDFDSVPVPDGIESVVFPPEKDDTDALCGIKEGEKRGYKDFLIIGALGKRIDHTLSNIYLLDYLYSHKLDGVIADGNCYLKIVSDNGVVVKKGCRYFSLLALFGKAEGIDIKGAKYNLMDGTIDSCYQYGVSNEVEDEEAVIRVEKGRLLLCVILKEDEDL